MDLKNYKLVEWQKFLIFYLIGVFVLSLGGYLVIETLFPTIYPTVDFNPITFLVVCVGLGWVIHGVGFYLVRR